MSQTSNGHPLDLKDPANGEPCPMERLADWMKDAPKPKWMRRHVFHYPNGEIYFEISGNITSPDQLDDLINYLARVKA